MIRLHFILTGDGSPDHPIFLADVHAVPRIGDQVRLGDGLYFTVTAVVWCMDETAGSDGQIQRADIGVSPLLESAHKGGE